VVDLVVDLIDKESRALLSAIDRHDAHAHAWRRAFDREKNRIWRILNPSKDLPALAEKSLRERACAQVTQFEEQRIRYQLALPITHN